MVATTTLRSRSSFAQMCILGTLVLYLPQAVWSEAPGHPTESFNNPNQRDDTVQNTAEDSGVPPDRSFKISETIAENKYDHNKPHESGSALECDSESDTDCAAVQHRTNMAEQTEPETNTENYNSEGQDESVPLDSSEKTATDSYPYVFMKWLKMLIEPMLEEFKEGMYTNTTESGNTSIHNESEVTLNNTSVELVNFTEPAFLNDTDTTVLNETDSEKKVKFHCVGRNITENTTAEVKLVNSTRLLQMLSFDKNKNDTENGTDCLLVMFFAPWCHFCAKTAPHYNALARAFPQLEFVAVDTNQFSNLLARFGTVSVPNVLVFHQSRAAVKFNQTERVFENFVHFIRNVTGLEPNTTVNVTEADYNGPVPSIPTDEADYLLWLSWAFVIVCSSYMFITSNRGQQWITQIGALWQEHQHYD